MGLLKEFKEFALKGSVIDMAVGVIIGGAFQSLITSFTDSFIQPVINLIGGGDVGGAVELGSSGQYITYGAFISAVINFLILALVLFLFIKSVNSLKKAGAKLKKNGQPEEEVPVPDDIRLLTEIKDLLAEQNAKN